MPPVEPELDPPELDVAPELDPPELDPPELDDELDVVFGSLPTHAATNETMPKTIPTLFIPPRIEH